MRQWVLTINGFCCCSKKWNVSVGFEIITLSRINKGTCILPFYKLTLTEQSKNGNVKMESPKSAEKGKITLIIYITEKDVPLLTMSVQNSLLSLCCVILVVSNIVEIIIVKVTMSINCLST